MLIAARQAHGENGFSVLGSQSHIAPMRPRNLAHNIQSKAEARPYIAAVILLKSTFKRIKDMVEHPFLNDRSTVLYFDNDFSLVAGKLHTNRRVWRSVSDCIH